MKKGCKCAACLAMMLVLLFSLSGCDALDQMRQQQAFYSVGGIAYNGTTYKLLPRCAYLSPDYGDDSKRIYVTEDDVPVLLSDVIYLDLFVESSDGIFLTGEDSDLIYCREELYNDLADRIFQGFKPEKVCYFYNIYDADTDEMQSQVYVLTQEQMAVVNTVLEEVEPITVGTGWYQDYDSKVWLEESSEDMLFRRDFAELSEYQGVYYLTESVTEETGLVYTVPKEYAPVFAQILDANTKAAETWNFGW